MSQTNLDQIRKSSENYKAFILLSFTKQILQNTRRYKAKIEEDLLQQKVNKIIKKKAQKIEPPTPIHQIPYLIPPERQIKSSLWKRPKFLSPIKPQKLKKKVFPIQAIHKNFTPPQRVGPLPLSVRNIKPIPQYIEINLYKLDPLVHDPTVNFIICNGSTQNIIVKRGSEKRTTSIVLSSEEINEIINSFSKTSKIPIEDFYKVVVGNLELNAINPKGESPKFIIKKLPPKAPAFIPKPL